jgi:hypothetical protein
MSAFKNMVPKPQEWICQCAVGLRGIGAPARPGPETDSLIVSCGLSAMDVSPANGSMTGVVYKRLSVLLRR